jgi:hypothetical protein
MRDTVQVVFRCVCVIRCEYQAHLYRLAIAKQLRPDACHRAAVAGEHVACAMTVSCELRHRVAAIVCSFSYADIRNQITKHAVVKSAELRVPSPRRHGRCRCMCSTILRVNSAIVRLLRRGQASVRATEKSSASPPRRRKRDRYATMYSVYVLRHYVLFVRVRMYDGLHHDVHFNASTPPSQRGHWRRRKHKAKP